MKNLKVYFSCICAIVLFALASCDDADIVCELDCQNGGTCISGDCYCPVGWTGEDCSEISDSTAIVPVDTMNIDTTMVFSLAGNYDVEVSPCFPSSFPSTITEMADGTLEISNFRGDSESLVWTADANNLEAIIVPNQTLSTSNGFEYTFSGVGDFDESTGIMNMTVVYTLFANVETCELIFTPQ